ncbi:MAG TPA: aromatic-ring-hydroxylating dioxygenase subunit beta [Burkholderiaceae bacterium]|nr:aromatic-ring-hydroxylating dioxygenase subunit beta [Burkholderiaceae bacterium]
MTDAIGSKRQPASRRERDAAVELVLHEARLLDERRWDDWLALYEPDGVLWVPTWLDEERTAGDPQRELSFMYLRGRAALGERVQRLTGGQSPAAMPLPRTTHVVAPGRIEREPDGGLRVVSSFVSHVYLPKSAAAALYSGQYEHLLHQGDGGRAGMLRIRCKRIVLINDLLQSRLDFFYV